MLLHHGTTKEFDAANIEEGRGLLRTGIYMSRNKEVAEIYGTALSYRLNLNAKLLDLSCGLILLNYMEDKAILEQDADPDWQRYISDGMYYQIDPFNRMGLIDAVLSEAREEGYHAVKLIDYNGAGEDFYSIVVLDKSMLTPIQNMQIELKKIKHFTAAGEETNAFHADLYIEGIRIGTAENSGKGEETYVRVDCKGSERNKDVRRSLLKRAEDYCVTLPSDTIEIMEGETITIAISLAYFIDTLVEQDLQYKQYKKKLKTHIFTKKDGVCYQHKLDLNATENTRLGIIMKLEARGEKVINDLPAAEFLKEVGA